MILPAFIRFRCGIFYNAFEAVVKMVRDTGFEPVTPTVSR
jgi:hypothetical protein